MTKKTVWLAVTAATLALGATTMLTGCDQKAPAPTPKAQKAEKPAKPSIKDIQAKAYADPKAGHATVVPVVKGFTVQNPNRIMTVGNSYTYYNCGINGYIRGFTNEDKHQLSVRMITMNAARLSWHPVEEYLKPHELDANAKKNPEKPYEIVFLQGQSRAPIDPKQVDVWRKYIAQHIESIRKANGEPALVVTWGRQDHPQEYRPLADSIITEANRHGVVALPVGQAFWTAIHERPDIVLHHTDKKHPSAHGSYLFGAVMYAAMYKKSPEGHKFLGGCAKPIPEADAKFLQQVAWKVTRDFYGWK